MTTATWTTPKGATVQAEVVGEYIKATINGKTTIEWLSLREHPQYGLCFGNGDKKFVQVPATARSAAEALHAAALIPARARRAKENKTENEYRAHVSRIYRAMDADEDREPTDRTPWHKGG